ncbi:MAG: DUF4332 domain-containing protein [Candidatus Sericytochromatia bacterium]|nr:DUF4332 domain-containing protein [Candidatus Sericytochromatia bacterium]
MRRFFLAALILSTLAAAGCGVNSTVIPAQATAGRVASAQALVEEGSLVFDKNVVYRTVDVLGIGPVYSAKLEAAGIKTVKQLLLAGTTRSARARLVSVTGISSKLLLTWINHADLMRVTGAGPEYSRLLERAGVDTVLELSRRNSVNLVAALRAANGMGGGKRLVKRLPNITTTTRWVDNANQFVRLITY